MLTEKISKHLGKPYVYLKDQKKFLCSNGVLFTKEEYERGIDINAEYIRREKEDKLYDYAYAKSTGILRKKRTVSLQTGSDEGITGAQEVYEKTEASNSDKDFSGRKGRDNRNETLQGKIHDTTGIHSGPEEGNTSDSGRKYNMPYRPEESQRKVHSNIQSSGSTKSDRERLSFSQAGNALVNKIESKAMHAEAQGSLQSEEQYAEQSRKLDFTFVIALLLAFTSVISGYISTLQTATYLYDYVDTLSAWLMSASVTAYNVTAFEVAVLFKQNRRYGLTLVFITLWVTVTFFSMATAVSVFYDRFNFNESVIAEENKNLDSNKLAIGMLQRKESDLREAISFKKKDIEYRQEHDYATTAVRLELEKLQAELQENLSEQQKLLSDTPEAVQETSKKKERLFAFLGRLMHVDSGVFEFTMSTLSAVFVNLIAPMSLVAVAEIKKKRLDKTN